MLQCLKYCWTVCPDPIKIALDHKSAMLLTYFSDRAHNSLLLGRYIFHTYYTLRTTKLLVGYIGFTTSVCLSVCPASRVHSVAPTVLVGSISYLCILSQLQTVCRVQSFLQNFKIGIFGNFFKFVTLTCVVWTWDLMWITSMGNHGVAGGISECRHYSCSSFEQFCSICALLL